MASNLLICRTVQCPKPAGWDIQKQDCVTAVESMLSRVDNWALCTNPHELSSQCGQDRSGLIQLQSSSYEVPVRSSSYEPLPTACRSILTTIVTTGFTLTYMYVLKVTLLYRPFSQRGVKEFFTCNNN